MYSIFTGNTRTKERRFLRQRLGDLEELRFVCPYDSKIDHCIQCDGGIIHHFYPLCDKTKTASTCFKRKPLKKNTRTGFPATGETESSYDAIPYRRLCGVLHWPCPSCQARQYRGAGWLTVLERRLR